MSDIRSFFGVKVPKKDAAAPAAAASKPSGKKTPGKAGSSSKAAASAAKPAVVMTAKKAAEPKKSPIPAKKPVVTELIDSDEEVQVIASPTPRAAPAAAPATASPAAKAAAESTPASSLRKRKARKIIIDSDDDENEFNDDDDDEKEETYKPGKDEGLSEEDAADDSDLEPEEAASSKKKKAAGSTSKAAAAAASSAKKAPAKKKAKTQEPKDGLEKGMPEYVARKWKADWGKSRTTPMGDWHANNLPKGSSQCLAGATIVITGNLPSLRREQAEDLIKQYGGKLTTASSSKTTILLYGELLEDGRPVETSKKYKTAVENKTALMGEREFLQLIADSNPAAAAAQSALKVEQVDLSGSDMVVDAPVNTSAKAPSAGATAGASMGATLKPPVVNPYQKKAVVNPYAKKAAPAAAAAAKALSPKKPTTVTAAAARSSGGGSSSSKGKSSGAAESSNQMWADKHKPTQPSEIIGHASEVKRMTQWLLEWDSIHRPKVVRSSNSNGYDDSDDAMSDDEEVKPAKGKKGKAKKPAAALGSKEKACLISGPPGIGKTTAAHVVAHSLGLHVTEFNASDVRSKLSLESEVKSVLGNSVLNFNPTSSAKGSKVKPQGRVIIMDEVDGMGAGDRGGMAELIALIKKSKVPIICICNDRQSTKVRSLVNHCLDLKFRRVLKGTIAKRMLAIAKLEGLEVDSNAAETLCEQVGNDIRQVMHAMEMWSKRSSTLKYMEVKGGLNGMNKDKGLGMTPFDGVKMILCEAATKSPADRREAFFSDYSLMPLMVQESWPSAMQSSSAGASEDVMLARMTKAAEAVSDADLVGAMVRGDVQHWELLPTYAALNVRVGVAIEKGWFSFAGFPQWLGQNSKAMKRKRFIAELMTHMNARVTGDRNAIRLNYMPVLAETLTEPLRKHGADGAEDCVTLLEQYGLSRDDLIEVLGDFTFTGRPNFIGSIDTKAKTALTKEYKATGQTSQALVEPLTAATKGKKAKRVPKSLEMSAKAPDDNRDDDDVIDDVDDAVSESDDEDYTSLAKKPAKGGKKGAAAAKKAPAKTAAKTKKATVTKAKK